jgi:hypothetical protein
MFSVVVSNTNSTINETVYWRKSGLLMALAALEGPVTITLPTENSTVVDLVLVYLQYGCLPHKTHPAMYQELERCLRYIATDDLRFVTFDDAILNQFNTRDVAANKRLTLYSVYRGSALVPLVSKAPSYPVVVRPRKQVKLPKKLQVAVRRIFRCPTRTCRRYEFIHTALHHLQCLVVAGGCLHFMHSPEMLPCDNTDIDLFVIGPVPAPIDVIVHQLGLIYEEFFGEYWVMRTAYAVTFFLLRRRHRNVVQVILRQHQSIEDLLDSFDIDASCFAYNGKSIVSNCRGLRAVQCGYNIVSVQRQSPSYVHRLLKYHFKYGFGICDPGFIPSRVIVCQKPLTGLANLLQTKDYKKQVQNNYSSWSAVSASSCWQHLSVRIHRAVKASRSTQPFILRRNNCDVFSLSVTEATGFRTEPAVQALPGWYAQAYGGSISRPSAQEEVVIGTFNPEWEFDLGQGWTLRADGLSSPIT